MHRRPQYKVPDTEGREGALYKFTYEIIFSFHALVDTGSTSSPGRLFKAGEKRPGDEVGHRVSLAYVAGDTKKTFTLTCCDSVITVVFFFYIALVVLFFVFGP